jgi:hypothetical protein
MKKSLESALNLENSSPGRNSTDGETLWKHALSQNEEEEALARVRKQKGDISYSYEGYIIYVRISELGR